MVEGIEFLQIGGTKVAEQDGVRFGALGRAVLLADLAGVHGGRICCSAWLFISAENCIFYRTSNRGNDWGEDRVVFFDTHCKLRSIRTSWTSLAEPDLFAQVSAVRSCFRVDGLLRLAAEVAELRARNLA